MDTQRKLFTLALSLAMFGAQSGLAQDPAPPAGETGGWRKFNERRNEPRDEPRNDERDEPRNDARPFSPPPAQLTMPAGSWITVRVNEPLSSDHNQAGDTFTATLVQPVVAEGRVIARRGQTVAGRVSEAQKAGRVKGVSRLAIELTEMSLVDGRQAQLQTQLVQHSAGSSTGRDAAAVGTATGMGAAIGAAADGGFGAGMGAIAGAAASTIGVLVTRGRATEVYPETVLTFRLDAPLTISTERAEEAFQPVQQQDYEQRAQLSRRPPQLARRPYYAPYPYWGPGYWGPGYYGSGVIIYGGGRGYGRRYGR